MNERKYFQKKCRNNKSLSRSIDQFIIESVHDIIEGSVFVTYISDVVLS